MRILALTLVLAMTSPARAEPCSRSVLAVTGNAMPCDGIIVPNATLAILMETVHEAQRLEADLDAERALRKSDAIHAAEMLAAEQKRRQAAEQAATEAAARPPVTVPSSPWMSLGIGAVVGLVVGGLVVGLLN